MKQPQSAFTLIEISIVITIIGLLVGGVLAGQSLIHAAQLKTVTTEFGSYKTALDHFKEKYQALPGDMVDAVSIWGAAAGGTTPGEDIYCEGVSSSILTCNGNGDGRIGFNNVNISTYPELWRAWQHLANAELIKGNFTGITNGDPANQGGINVPKSRFPNATWLLGYFDGSHHYQGSSNAIDVPGNFLVFVGSSDNKPMPSDTNGEVLSNRDASNIDAKMDDGKPLTGMVLTNMHSGDCYDSNANDQNIYQLSNPNIACVLFMNSGY